MRSVFGTLRRRIAGLYGALLTANLLAWFWAALAFRQQPLLLGTALVAYGLGLRHAVDADHIAAIDNVTRKLREQGDRPVTVGFHFAVGHSAVVFLAVAAVAATASALSGTFAILELFGSAAGTLVSAGFLFAIAAANLGVLAGVWRSFREVRRGRPYLETDLDLLLNGRGLLARLFRPLFALVRRSWHMLPLGFLFGLGFDTATEVALLGLSSAQAAKGGAIWSIMVFPALFAAGMSLIDTTDGVLMLGAYDWAFARPLRKLAYNLVVTAMSVLAAVVVGGVEMLGLLSGTFGFSGRFLSAIGALNDNSAGLGCVVIGIFITAWIGSVVVCRYGGIAEAESS